MVLLTEVHCTHMCTCECTHVRMAPLLVAFGTKIIEHDIIFSAYSAQKCEFSEETRKLLYTRKKSVRSRIHDIFYYMKKVSHRVKLLLDLWRTGYLITVDSAYSGHLGTCLKWPQ